MSNLRRVIALGIASTFLVCSQGGAKTLTVLYRFSVAPSLFKSSEDRRASIDSMSAGGGRLVFLIRPASGSQKALLITDEAGGVLSTTGLSDDDVLDLTADDHGNSWVLSQTPNGLTHIQNFDVVGNKIEDFQVQKNFWRLLIFDSTLWGITGTGSVIPITHQRLKNVSFGLENRDNSFTFAVSGDEAIVVDQVSAEVAAIDVGQSTTTKVTITSPEVARIRSSYAHDRTVNAGVKGLVILAATGVRSSGRTYLMLSGFRAEDGAPLIVLDRDLSEIETLKVPMTYKASTDSRPVTFIPAAIAANDGKLFVVDQGGCVYVYQL